MILICKDCFVTTQVSHEQPSFSSPNYIKFCPCCGSQKCLVNQDMEDEAWFEISKHLNIPVDATKKLYELWDREENANFVKWINSKRGSQ